jgi:pimeloyl-ACP methyl ester carboxylesterase
MRVYLWQGGKDRNVRAIDGRHQAQAIPDCRATFYPDEGHLLTIDHLDEIFAAVIAERDA